MLKRILVLAAMLCLLFLVSTAKPAHKWVNCSCGMACSGGKAICQYSCEGDPMDDFDAAINSCCQSAQDNTPVDCRAN
jgi:hypothetical protein